MPFTAGLNRMIDFQRFQSAVIKFERECLDGQELLAVEGLLRQRGYRLHPAGPDLIAVLPD